MKILHTSDWHVGKTIRGRSRLDEHRAVLAEVASVAAEGAVDLVVVAGDLFETAAPGPDAEQVVYAALLDLARLAPVVVVAGNHDHPLRLRAVAPLLELGRIRVATAARPAGDGGVTTVEVASGERARVALLPFVSQRGIVRADELMSGAGYEHAQAYAERLVRIVEHLSEGADGDAVNLLVAHLFVAGGVLGGGERSAHTILDYSVPGVAFPPSLGYVALGHLHRAQSVPGATAIHYAGSPLALDFGESADVKGVNLVEIEPGTPARVTPVPITAGRPLVTVAGGLADIADAVAGLTRESWLRVRVTEARRAGLADEVRAAAGDRADWLVDITVEAAEDRHRRRPARRLEGRSPQDLFAEFCAERNVADDRIRALFAELYEEAAP